MKSGCNLGIPTEMSRKRREGSHFPRFLAFPPLWGPFFALWRAAGAFGFGLKTAVLGFIVPGAALFGLALVLVAVAAAIAALRAAAEGFDRALQDHAGNIGALADDFQNGAARQGIGFQ